METKEVFDNFLKDLKNAFPEIEIPSYSVDEVVKHIETEYYPLILQILQRDDTFFNGERTFCGINLTQIWNTSESTHEAIWKHLQMSLFASFLHGDMKEKLNTIISTFKNIWNSSGQENSEVTRILNDENSEGHFKEIIDYISETRLAKIFMEIVENIDITELDINLENPQEIIETLKNPENPIMKKIITKIQSIIQSKLQRGEFTQHQLQSEVEAIKAKVTGIFGNVFNDALGGTRSELPPSVLMGNSPEARKQRMLARLQKKQRDRK